MGKKIYLASPFFEEKELLVIEKVERILRRRGFEVFSPREFVIEGEEGSPEWAVRAFDTDRQYIKKSDCILMLYYGNYSDSGTAWECGYAYGTGKPVVAVHLGDVSNLMVHTSCRANIRMEDLENYDFDSMPALAYEGPML